MTTPTRVNVALNELEQAIDDWKHANYATCFPVIRRYAEAGEPEAQFVLALALSSECWGVNEDVPAAADWLRKAHANGHPHAVLHLAIMLDPTNTIHAGKIRPDQAEAERYYRIAFSEYRRRAAYGEHEFMYALGNCYACGWGTEVDHDEAERLHAQLRAAGYNVYTGKCDAGEHPKTD